MDSKTLGERLKELRKKSGYTQRQVVEFLNLGGTSTVGTWEIGQAQPNATMFLKLCNLYGVTNFKEFVDVKEDTDILSVVTTLNSLNQEGREELLKRSLELTQLPQYKKDKP